MRFRGKKFWVWADPTLHHRCHEEVLDDGTMIDVETRLSRTGETQLFFGVYAATGALIAEEVYHSRPHETMTRALAWGLEQARAIAVETFPTSKRASARTASITAQ